MAAMNEHTTFGASIQPSSSPYQHDTLLPRREMDSPALTPAVSHEDMNTQYHDQPNIPVHSPFYQHPPASFERVHSRQTSKNNIYTHEKDLEANHLNDNTSTTAHTLTPLSATANHNPDTNPFTSKVSVEHSKECTMWPSKQTLMQDKAAARQKKNSRKGYAGCAPARAWWAQFDRRHKLVMKVLIALFVVGAIVGICVGISVAVHGTYYSNSGQAAVGQT
ncbi:hypothetical protein LTR91_024446 [Friedmanniomyces endolithicus]|uniref:Uncharacterized protein n=1 Tax=Friedmanniomyces endolithicus TaxID=329885 RepID=A0A4U0UUJ4_9PEZI|nr:hypothetical protein LTS09_003887 [Friedmanniomyces endolithicus]KAK0304497.1 hypothetical protein LTR82_017169 [Friedmanniomyces endolithicus]KAK0833902.1 hypothetical protein LTR73_001665 [Friedmanniomyces endolithicus]KAK0952367.1 hypothetical protein LTR91_024446 [Friedmanniomyces endolithicus]KAK1050004.1 hypothetical protein LTS16_003460 [Friedmanniomyces endolithicus]